MVSLRDEKMHSSEGMGDSPYSWVWRRLVASVEERAATVVGREGPWMSVVGVVKTKRARVGSVSVDGSMGPVQGILVGVDTVA